MSKVQSNLSILKHLSQNSEVGFKYICVLKNKIEVQTQLSNRRLNLSCKKISQKPKLTNCENRNFETNQTTQKIQNNLDKNLVNIENQDYFNELFSSCLSSDSAGYSVMVSTALVYSQIICYELIFPAFLFLGAVICSLRILHQLKI